MTGSDVRGTVLNERLRDAGIESAFDAALGSGDIRQVGQMLAKVDADPEIAKSLVAEKQAVTELRRTGYIVASLLVVQAAFGFYVKHATGAPLLPPISESVAIAVGMWSPLPVMLLIYALMKSDRAAPLASVRRIFGRNFNRILTVLAVLFAFAVSFSFINWTKAMIPAFTADIMLADLDAWIFGGDPWEMFDVAFLRGVMAQSYAFWFPVIYGFMVWSAWSRQSQAILSMFLIAAVDTVAQFALPSAGPIFWSRLGMGDRFVDLESGPTTYTFFSDHLWRHYESGTVAAGTGISAMPSMHVALSAWLILSFHKLRAFTVPFFLVVFAASVASGWHYFTDGVAGCVMAYAAHHLAKLLSPRKCAEGADNAMNAPKPA